PMPPSPSNCSTRYTPIVVPGAGLLTIGAVLLAVILRVGDLLEPLRLTAEADVDLDRRLARRSAVPVHDVRTGVVALALAELFHRAALLLRPHPAVLDHQQLTVAVAVPEGAGARLETA